MKSLDGDRQMLDHIHPIPAGNPAEGSKVMRTIKAGLALAVAGSMVLSPLAAAGRQNGIISGSAAAEAKQPYSQYVIRAVDTSNNQIAQATTLDSQGKFAVSGLTAGSFLIELVKGATPNGQGGKVVCTAGPFTLQDSASQVNDLMIKKGANVHCNKPVAALWLLAAAGAAGVTAAIVANGDDPAPVPVVTVTPTVISGAQ
jgi:hypothetical protein